MKLSSDRVKLFLSLFLNGISKLPALLLVIWILPHIRDSLGLHTYTALLAALALGNFFTLPFGGVNIVARRLVGAQFGRADEAGQADAFVSSVVVTAAVTALACLIAVVLSLTVFAGSMSPIAAAAATVPIIAAGVNFSDNVRAAFNEHYVTAAMQSAFQLLVYVPVILLRPTIGGILVATLIMQAPMMLASIVQLTLLLIKRPYLLRGSLRQVPEVLRGSMVFSIGEGALVAAQSASVFFVGTYGSPGEGAWYGTFVRLYQTLLAPLMLLMFPVSAFVASKWGGISAERRRLLITLSLIFGLCYGGISATALAIGGQVVLVRLYHIMPVASHLQIAAVSVLFMGTMSAKTYGLIVYVIDHGRFLSVATFFAVLTAVLVGALSAIWNTPLQTVSLFALVEGLCLIAVMTGDGLRRRRAVSL